MRDASLVRVEIRILTDDVHDHFVAGESHDFPEHAQIDFALLDRFNLSRKAIDFIEARTHPFHSRQ